MFKILNPFNLGYIKGRVFKSDTDSIALCRVDGVNSFESASFIADLQEYVSSCNLVLFDLPHVSYNDSQWIYNQIGSHFTYNNDEICKGVSKIFFDADNDKKRVLSESLFYVFKNITEEVNNISKVNNLYISTLVLLRKVFSSFYISKGFKDKLFYAGKVGKIENVIFTVLAFSGVDCVILSGTENPPKEYSKYFTVIDGDVKDLDLGFLQKYIKKDNYENTVEIKNPFVSKGNENTGLKNITIPIKTEQKFQYIKPLKNRYSGNGIRINTGVVSDDVEEILKYTQSGYNTGRESSWEVIRVEFQGGLEKSKYQGLLAGFKNSLESIKRPFVIFDKEVPVLSMDENNWFSNNITSLEDIFSKYLVFQNSAIINSVYTEFINIFKERTFSNDTIRNNYENVLVFWLAKYLEKLYSQPNVLPVLIVYGVLNKKHFDFLRIISHLPMDIVVFNPFNISESVYEKLGYKVFKIGNVLNDFDIYPTKMPMIQSETVAFQAEQELNTLLYSDSMLFRVKQFTDINPITLKTTYDEVFILWDEPAKYRPNFSVLGNIVNVPNIFLKVNGCDKNYVRIKEKIYNDTTSIVEQVPIFDPIILQNSDFFRFLKGVVFRDHIDYKRIIESSFYRYSIYSEETQNFIVSRIQKLIDLNWCKIVDKNLVYKILWVGFSLPENILNLIHNFDYTGKIPKLVCYFGSNDVMTLEDAIYIMLLKVMGFDILILSPTGYNSIELFIQNELFNSVIIGEYKYDWRTLGHIPNEKKSFFSQFFG